MVRKDKTQILSLTNSGDLSLFFLGVGSAFTKKHFQTNLLIVKGQDHLLVDCGTKAAQAFYELGVPITSISNFLITHSHADHIGGLEEVMLMGRYVTKKKPNIIITPAYQQILWDLSLRGGASYNEETDCIYLSFCDFWEIIRPRWLSDYPRETHEADIGSINIKIFRTKHIPEKNESWESSFWSCGVLIDERILFTGDTRFDPELLEEYCSRFPVETIFHDCQFFKGGVHTSLEELSSLPRELKNRIYLVHYGDNYRDYESLVKKQGFKGFTKQWHTYRFPLRRRST